VERKSIRSRPGKTQKVPETWLKVAAYYIWQKEGCPFGRDIEHWNLAKAELAAMSQFQKKATRERDKSPKTQRKSKSAVRVRPSLNP
jgi:hypothetical protein